jgi:2-iminobutanoate/2-iminopropanoate deaminase
MKKIIYTKNAPEPIGPYSQAAAVGPFLFCSGQIPIHAETGEVLQGSVAEQAELVMKNIQAVLTANQMDFSHIVKTTIFLANMSDFAAVNQVYGKYFTSNFPARSTVAVAGLPKNVQVEIEVLAHRA